MAELFEFLAHVLFEGLGSLVCGLFEWAVTRRPKAGKAGDQACERPADSRDPGGRLK